MDGYDKILQLLSQRHDEWDAAARRAIVAEANFKQYEASTKKAYMDAGETAAKAEAALRAGDGWKEQFVNYKTLEHEADLLKKKIALGEMYWETERSRQASLRKIGI